MPKTEYVVEAWSRRCIAFKRTVRVPTAMREAIHYVVDLGADEAIIRVGAKTVARRTPLFWRDVTDPKIQAAIDAAEQ